MCGRTPIWAAASLAGCHHFCLNVVSVDATVAELRARGVTMVAEPFVVEEISRRLAFFADPFGNLIELAEVIAPQPPLERNPLYSAERG